MTTRLKAGDAAPDVTVLDRRGEPFSVSELWRTGPVLLSFLRHFG
jgi:peroxiredoxin